MKQINFFKSYKSIIAFLILEVMALVSFTFANINEVFYLIATALAICAFVFAFFTNVERKDFLKLAPVVGLLFVISGIAAFGGFSHEASMFSNIAIFFAIPSFFSLGFFIRRLSDFKTEYVILAIGFGLAAITLIGTLITWIQYGPFYTEIHKAKPIYFYEGTAYDVRTEMGWLMGFRVTEVSIEYGGFFAILCAAFLPGLLFIKTKENKNLFISTAVIGGIGLVSLITIPNWKALIFLVIASAFAFIYKFLKEKKLVVNILSLCVVVVVGIGVIFYLLTIINAAVGFKIGGVLNRLLCDNFIMRPATNTLSAAFAKDLNGNYYNLFGYDLSNPSSSLVGEDGLIALVHEPTLIFEYEIIKEVGIVGTFFVLAFFAAMFVFVVFYIRDSKDSAFIKNVVVMMLLAFMLYGTFGFNIISESHNVVYNAFLRSVPFMIALFLFGFTYFGKESGTKQDSKKVEDVNL